MAKLHEFKEGDLVTYFKPMPGRTEKYIARIVRAPEGRDIVRILYWVDGKARESTVKAENLSFRREVVEGLH